MLKAAKKWPIKVIKSFFLLSKSRYAKLRIPNPKKGNKKLYFKVLN